MSAFPDTGPQPDGTRTAAQWKNAMSEDMGIVRMQIDESLREGATREEIALAIALARKEAQRLVSDIWRFGQEVHGLTTEDMNKVGPL